VAFPQFIKSVNNKTYDTVRITEVMQQNFPQCDPVLIRQSSKKLLSDPAKIAFNPDP